jgi:hypothetical protein
MNRYLPLAVVEWARGTDKDLHLCCGLPGHRTSFRGNRATKTLRKMANVWTVATGVEMLISPMTPGQFPGCGW